MKKNATAKALVMSVLSLMLCLSMLVGTTFAWFTDSVTSGVNKIVAGNLDVDLVDKDGNSLAGQTLDFVKAEGAEGEEILWEPGCTYKLPEIYIKNNGTLALKYKILVDGLNGDAKLLEAIEWSIKIGEAEINLDEYEGTLEAGQTSEQALILQGHMREDAGNEYQGLTAEGISISVLATQDTVESDSFDNKYDENADYVAAFTTGTHTIHQDFFGSKPNAFAVKVSGADTSVTIEGGTIDGGSGGNNQAVHVRDGATVVINDGTFTVGGDATGAGNSVIESYDGKITINGGFFYTNYAYNGKYYVLNQNNSHPGTITVTGGTFVNYNPAWGDDYLNRDRWGTNVIEGGFVAEGYAVSVDKKENGDTWYTVGRIESYETLEDAFAGTDFGYGATKTDPISIDGKGLATVTEWTDAWFQNDLTIKGVTFQNGATFSARNLPADGAVITLENCTFYACDQDKVRENPPESNLRNTGAGMCLDIETAPGLTVIIKNCTFIGDGGPDVERMGWQIINPDSGSKARGHGICINGISGTSKDKFESVLIEGCEINNTRGNAIQLYNFNNPITIKDTRINSWGQNKQTLGGEKDDAAIRGTLLADAGQSLLTLENVYFGMNENADQFYHINVDNYLKNTNGSRVSGIYSSN